MTCSSPFWIDWKRIIGGYKLYNLLESQWDTCDQSCLQQHSQNMCNAGQGADLWRGACMPTTCQRWWQIIFASPRCLNLTLLCTDGTPVRQNLDHFPTLPIAILYGYPKDFTPDDEDNLSAALEHPDLVVFINIYGENSQLGKAATVMQESFPVLTVLQLMSMDQIHRNPLALPDEFLGGSAPCLQEIELQRIS